MEAFSVFNAGDIKALMEIIPFRAMTVLYQQKSGKKMKMLPDLNIRCDC